MAHQNHAMDVHVVRRVKMKVTHLMVSWTRISLHFLVVAI